MADAVLGLIPERTDECLMPPPGQAGVGAAGIRHRLQEGEVGQAGARQGEAGGGVREAKEGVWKGWGDYLWGGLGKWLRMACLPA